MSLKSSPQVKRRATTLSRGRVATCSERPVPDPCGLFVSTKCWITPIDFGKTRVSDQSRTRVWACPQKGTAELMHRYRTTVNRCLALDVFALRLQGAFAPGGRHMQVVWFVPGSGLASSSNAAPQSSHKVDISTNEVLTQLTIQLPLGCQRVGLEQTPCHFGGGRFWFRCPPCVRRVAKLYLPAGELYFLCRHCHNLTYASCRGYSRRRRHHGA